MHWATIFTVPSQLLPSLLYFSVCAALPARLGPETSSAYARHLAVRKHVHWSEINLADVHTSSATSVSDTRGDIHSLYAVYLSMEAHGLSPIPSPTSSQPAYDSLETTTTAKPTSSSMSLVPTTVPNSSNIGTDDDSRLDGLGVATWLMGIIFGLFLCVSIGKLLTKACGCGQRKPEQSSHQIVSATTPSEQDSRAREKAMEIKVIEVTKQCPYSRFSDYSSEALSFATDLEACEPIPVHISQLGVTPKPQSTATLLRPSSLFPAFPAASSILRKTRHHFRTYSAPERRQQRKTMIAPGHVKGEINDF